MGMIPTLTLEQTQDLLVHNHQLQQQVENQQNIGVILAMALFKALGKIETNRIVAVGHAALNIKEPLITSITQNDINGLAEIFPGDQPILGFEHQQVGNDIHLLIKLVPRSQAEREIADMQRPQ